LTKTRDELEDTAPQGIGRLEQLSEAVSRIRGGRRLASDRIQLIVGAIFIVVGLLAIVLGWYGAAHTGFAFEQTPYLISGGLLGLGLCFVGGFLYFAYWVTQLIREARTQSDRASELLDRIAETLDGAASSNGSRTRARSNPGPTRGGAFVATRNGSQFHRPDCPVVVGREGLRRVAANAKGMQPCRICDPLGT
jgi:hypothetical protein